MKEIKKKLLILNLIIVIALIISIMASAHISKIGLSAIYIILLIISSFFTKDILELIKQYNAHHDDLTNKITELEEIINPSNHNELLKHSNTILKLLQELKEVVERAKTTMNQLAETPKIDNAEQYNESSNEE